LRRLTIKLPASRRQAGKMKTAGRLRLPEKTVKNIAPKKNNNLDELRNIGIRPK
jgi:hypothetical protein